MVHNKAGTMTSFKNDRRIWRVQKAAVIKMWFKNSPIRIGLTCLAYSWDFSSLRNGHVNFFSKNEYVHVWKDYTGFTF